MSYQDRRYSAQLITDPEAADLTMGVRYWSVYAQQWREVWQSGRRIPDQDYAALSDTDKALIDRIIP